MIFKSKSCITQITHENNVFVKEDRMFLLHRVYSVYNIFGNVNKWNEYVSKYTSRNINEVLFLAFVPWFCRLLSLCMAYNIYVCPASKGGINLRTESVFCLP